MATKGKLTDDQMDILETWISKGPKTFTLLYAITNDGCNATTFHEKCDNKGPTVTVLYNQQGSVYGGYADKSWSTSSGYGYTTDSFLFQLSCSGCLTANKFSLRQNKHQYFMCCNINYGPAFGYVDEPDLLTFCNFVPNAGGYWQLNGNMANFGKCFDNQAIASDKINNGTMNVTELEVYTVADGKRQKTVIQTDEVLPWRKSKEWNNEFFYDLMDDIVAFRPREEVKVKALRILMIGPAGGGKSSFYNTINSIFLERISHAARSGSAEQILTTAYTPYTPRLRNGKTLLFQFCDTRGLEEFSGITEGELVYILNGNVPDYYEFVSKPLSFWTRGFKWKPSPDDKIHCAVFLLDAATLDVLPARLLTKMKNFQKEIDKRGIPQLVILTKIDKLCTDVEKNISFAFKSKQVEKKVGKASQILGLPRSNVLPVKNYENEVELDINTSILALIALRQILNFAEDYFDNISERERRMPSAAEQNSLYNYCTLL